jgi:hypothetical protein
MAIEEKFLEFDKKEISELLNVFGLKIKDGKIVDKEGNVLKCPMCSIELTEENLGFVFPVSSILICDNPTCALAYILERKICW